MTGEYKYILSFLSLLSRINNYNGKFNTELNSFVITVGRPGYHCALLSLLYFAYYYYYCLIIDYIYH